MRKVADPNMNEVKLDSITLLCDPITYSTIGLAATPKTLKIVPAATFGVATETQM